MTSEVAPHGETAALRVDADALVQATVSGDRDRAAVLLSPLQLPPGDPMTGEGLILEGVDLVTRLVGIQCLVTHMRVRGDVRFAGELALRLIEALGTNGLMAKDRILGERMMAANIIDSCASCLTDAGKGQEVLSLAAEWSSWLDEVSLSPQWRSLQHARVDAALHAGRYEIASEVISEIERRFADSSSHPIEQRLRDKLDDLYRAVDRPDTPSVGLAWTLERSLELIAGSQLPDVARSSATPDLDTLIAEMRKRIGLSSPPRDIAALALRVSRLPTAPHPADDVGGILEAFATMLQAPGTLPRDQYLELARLALMARSNALGYGFWDQATSLGWTASVALRRAGELGDAADLLAQLRADVRARQLGIADPRLRAALAMYLPHLAGVSVKVLHDLGPAKAKELFVTLEESKARILGDLIAGRFGPSPNATPDSIRALLEREEARAAYLTVLCDDDETYAALQGREGDPQCVRLPLGRADIAAASHKLAVLFDGDPNSLTGGAGIDPDEPWACDPRLILDVLRPLGEWIATLFDHDFLRPGDVLCISPDGPLYNLPLAALDVAGVPLVERAAVTITPSAAILLGAAESRGRGARARGLAMVVPRSTEFENGPLYDRALYQRDAEELAARHVTLAPPPVECDRTRLLAADLANSFVHLAGHGEFDASAPLDRSGLGLAFAGQLPPGVGQRPREGLFTPRDAEHLRARGAHITLRACVSGRTTEVSSREALGMIWALFQSGASSVVAASWHADVRSLSPLLTAFYRSADSPLAIAHAHREAMLSLRRASPVFSHPYHYAALSLYGFWR